MISATIYVICEGATEEMFVKELLELPLAIKGVFLIPILIGKPGHKGGNVNFPRLLSDTKKLLFGNTSCYCTTLIDYYALPQDFPGKTEANNKATTKSKLQCVTESLSKKLAQSLGEATERRFIPYVQMHEFEGLLFSHPQILAQKIKMPKSVKEFEAIKNKFKTPEDINDSPNTAPSKRIEKIFPGYDKPKDPILVAKEIGIDTIRKECPLFDGWIKQLETKCQL